MTPKISQKMIDKFMGQNKPVGNIATPREMKFQRQCARLKKLAKRIYWKRATKEELIIFEEYKKKLGVDHVTYDKYNKEYVLMT